MREIVCSTGEKFYNYSDYLKGKHWQKVRAKYYATYKEKVCSMCESTKNLNLHHLRYTSLGKEKLTDIVLVCKDCHSLIHKELKASDASFLKEYQQKDERRKRKYKKRISSCKKCIDYSNGKCLIDKKVHTQNCRYYKRPKKK